MQVGVIDLGLNNISSVVSALEGLGASVNQAPDPNGLGAVDRLVLPGVGNFAFAMQRMIDLGWDQYITAAVHDNGTPLLGICLGMHMLSQSGTEGGLTAGLALLPGKVKRIESSGERLPHMGWNSVKLAGADDLFDSIPSGADFYFAHSYAYEAAPSESVMSTTSYGVDFCSAARSGGVCGVQFHPEKSSTWGLQLLSNFMARCV
jgi:glutamine amidotransferase